MGPSQGKKPLLGGPEYGFKKILKNRAIQKKIKKLKSNSIIHGFFTIPKVFGALKVLIIASNMVRDHGLVFESF